VQTSPAPAPPVDALLSWRLAVAGRLVRSLADATAGAPAGGGAALAVLMHLGDEDGLTQVELARRQRVEAPTMCRLVDRLERAGLVTRVRRPDDRRAVRVTLTPEGRRTADRGRREVEALEERAFAGLDPDERAALAALLERVLGSLGPAEAA